MSRERWPVASGVRGPVFVKWDRQKTVQLGAIPGIVYDPRPLSTPLVHLQPYAFAASNLRPHTLHSFKDRFCASASCRTAVTRCTQRLYINASRQQRSARLRPLHRRQLRGRGARRETRAQHEDLPRVLDAARQRRQDVQELWSDFREAAN